MKDQAVPRGVQAVPIDPATGGRAQDATEFAHPEVGPLSLVSLSFDVRSAPGQILVVYQPEPDSSTAQALSLLGALDATRRQQSSYED
jgi:hypothetical protein